MTINTRSSWRGIVRLNRVAITGMGVVTPYGYGVEKLIQGIRDRKSTIRYLKSWEDYSGLKSKVGAPAELRDESRIPRHKRRSMSPMSLHSIAASEEALAQAGIDRKELSSFQSGTVAGSTMGSAKSINELFEIVLPDKELENIPSMLFFKCMSHTLAMNIAQHFGLNGIVLATNAACASGLQAIGTGYEMIRLGQQDVMLCGGAEELHQTVTGIFDILNATSIGYNDSPSLTPRPFDRDRDGLVCGEGAGIVVLEEYGHARRRGAEILAEVVGYNTSGSGAHISQSNAAMMEKCLRRALRSAALDSSDIDFVSAHATATIQGDQAEAEAISKVFGNNVPVSSIKGNIGHTMGAAGAIELSATIAMMHESIIYPGLNLENVAPDCEGLNHVMRPIEKRINYSLKNSFAFGGINCSLIIKNAKKM